MCKVIYRADDGKEFDTAEKCKEYSALPRIWVVTKDVRGFNAMLTSVVGVFTHQVDAKEYIDKNVRNMYESYHIKSYLVNGALM